MKTASIGRWFLACALVLACAAPGLAGPQKERIRVSVEGARLRIKPDLSSEIIANPAVGTVYEVEARVGEWFEVKHTTRVGIQVTGYIHRQYVDVVKEPAAAKPEPATKEKPPAPETPPAGAAPPARLRISLSLSGLYQARSGYDHSYSATYYGETLKLTDSLASGGGFGGGFGLGLFLGEMLELAAGVDITSATLDGHYGIDLPNTLIYNNIAHAETAANSAASSTELSLGIVLHPVRGGSLDPYFGAGASYVLAKMRLVKDLNYSETYFSDQTHTVELTGVQFSDESMNAFGGHVRAGLHVWMSPRVSFFVEGRYLLAKAEIPHPLTSQLGVTDQLKLDLGGAAARIGVRLVI